MEFSINGYWKGDNSEFEDYIVTDWDCTPEGYDDDDIFMFGMKERDIKAIMDSSDKNSEFVVTSYHEI